MKPINIIQITEPKFTFEGEHHWVQTKRFRDFRDFQDNIDYYTDKGYTHCFIFSIFNQHDGNMMIDHTGTETEVWVRYKFLKIE